MVVATAVSPDRRVNRFSSAAVHPRHQSVLFISQFSIPHSRQLTSWLCQRRENYPSFLLSSAKIYQCLIWKLQTTQVQKVCFEIFSGLVQEQLISIPPRLTGKRFWYDIVLLLFYPYISNSDRRPLHNTRKKPTWLASDFSDIEETVHHIRRVQMEKWEAFDLRMEGIGSSPRSLYGLATRAIIQHFKRSILVAHDWIFWVWIIWIGQTFSSKQFHKFSFLSTDIGPAWTCFLKTSSLTSFMRYLKGTVLNDRFNCQFVFLKSRSCHTLR